MIRANNISVCAAVGSCCISLVLLVAIAMWNTDYLSIPTKNQFPDALDYLKLAEGIATKGEFSRTADGQPDILRTPLYPIFLATFNAFRHPLLLYLVQCGMLAASVGLIVRLANAWFGFPSAVVVMVLLWIEYRLHIMCFQAMSEIASLFFLLCGLSVIDWPAFPVQQKLTLIHSIFAGILLAFGVMIRPATLYLPVLMWMVALVYYWIQTPIRPCSKLGPLVALPITYSILPVLWMLRNWFVFGVFTFTPVSSHNLIFFAGAGAWQFKYGVERFEAQDMLVRQFQIPSYTVAQNPHSQNQLTVRQIEESLQSRQWQILWTHPMSLIASSMIGIVKASMDHTLDSLGYLLNRPWKSIGVGELLRFRSDAWAQLGKINGTLLVGLSLYALQLVSLWSCVGIGFYQLLRKGLPSPILVGLGLLLAYGYLVVALFGMDATFRSTVAVLPALYLLAGYAFSNRMLDNSRSVRGSDV